MYKLFGVNPNNPRDFAGQSLIVICLNLSDGHVLLLKESTSGFPVEFALADV